MNTLTGKRALVTGAARGIGREIAKALAAEGADVAINYQSSEAEARALAQEIERMGRRTLLFKGNIGERSTWDTMIAKMKDNWGGIDVLVNNAGIGLRHPAVDHPLADWDKVVAVNLTGVFLCARTAARTMLARGGGAIVNLASIMGFSGGGVYPNVSYQATKGAVVNMTRALAVEWAKSGIRVNAVAPTWVKTDLTAALLAQPDVLARIEALTPMARLATPEEVAHAILFLASPAAAMVTGHTLPVDGGFLAQ